MTPLPHSIESLEHRRHLAADPILSLSAKGTLGITGTSGADAINVSLLHNKPADGFRALVISGEKTFELRAKFAKVKRIYIDAGGGIDDLFIGSGAKQTRPATMLGGGGNDKLNYSAAGAIFASGGAGDDTVGATAIITVKTSRNKEVIQSLFAIENTTSVNTIAGAAGNDTLSGDTNDSVDGGAGNDLGVIGVVSTTTAINADRRNALSELYYARLGAISIEATAGFDLFE